MKEVQVGARVARRKLAHGWRGWCPGPAWRG